MLIILKYFILLSIPGLVQSQGTLSLVFLKECQKTLQLRGVMYTS